MEGIDPLTSGTFQALHSYMPEDIEWNASFVSCITSTTALEATFVDLTLFHATKPTMGPIDEEETFRTLKHATSYGTEQV